MSGLVESVDWRSFGITARTHFLAPNAGGEVKGGTSPTGVVLVGRQRFGIGLIAWLDGRS